MAQRIDLRDALRVRPGSRVRLARQDHGETHGWDKEAAAIALATQLGRMADLQDRFWAEGKRSILVVLQGIDAAGKDGTINKVMEAFNPQGCPVTSFKVPSDRGTGPRLPLARPPEGAAQGRDRHLQSVALRGRAGRARP